MSVKAVVYKENTLGLLGVTFDKPSIEVLNGLVSIGGKTMNDSPLLFVDQADFRPATMADFDTFSVVWSPSYEVIAGPGTRLAEQGRPYKSANASRVLELMDSCEDGGRRYGEFVRMVASEAGVSREQLEEELDPFI